MLVLNIKEYFYHSNISQLLFVNEIYNSQLIIYLYYLTHIHFNHLLCHLQFTKSNLHRVYT
jgi:hypothetical protein